MDKLEKYVLFTSFITMFSAIFILRTIAIGAPSIGKAFLMNNVTQNWILTIGSIFISAFSIPAGQICSKFGCKKMFIIGCLIFLIGLILSVTSISAEMFLFSRAVTSIGYAIFFVSEIAIVILAINKKSHGKALGIVYVAPYIASVLAPSVGGYLINNFGWKSVFYLAIPFMVICVVIMSLKVDKEWIPDENSKLDLTGCSLYVLGITLFAYGFSDLHSLIGQISAVIGIVILILFGVYESRVKLPVFKIKLFKNKLFAAYNIVGFLEFFAIAVFDVLFSYYFQYAKGWDPQLTGLILIIPPILLVIITPLIGRLSDKVHPQKLSTVGLVIFLIPLIGLMFLDVQTPLYLIVITLILIAVGTGIFSVPNTNAVMSSVEEKEASYASATQITLRSCGQTMSYGILTLVCSFVMGNLPLSIENAGLFVSSARIIAFISLIICIIAIILAIWGIRYDAKVNQAH